MIGDLFNEHYHHNKSLYDLLLCIQSLHVLMYGFITYFVMDKWRVWGTSFLTNPNHRVTRSRILTLVRTSVTLFQISPQCRTSRWSSRRPHRRSLQVSLSCPVLAVEYSTSCTAVQLYSVQSPPCAAVCSRPTALRSSVGNPGPQRKSPFILGLVLHRHHPPASLLHYHIILPLVAALDPPHHNHNRRDPTNG